MQMRKLSHGDGNNPIGYAMQAAAENDLRAFKQRMEEIRRSIQI